MSEAEKKQNNISSELQSGEKEDIFDRIMKWPFLRIFEPFYKRNKGVLMYLFFGGLTFFVNLIAFAVCNSAIGMNELIANIIAWVVAVAFAYYTNRLWVFNAMPKTRSEFWKQISSFFAGRLVTLGVEELIIFIFITKMGLAAMPVKIAAQIIVIILNYIISKVIVFKKGV